MDGHNLLVCPKVLIYERRQSLQAPPGWDLARTPSSECLPIYSVVVGSPDVHIVTVIVSKAVRAGIPICARLPGRRFLEPLMVGQYLGFLPEQLVTHFPIPSLLCAP